MKIALLGYGKMGKFIEQLALAAGHEIVLKISSSNAHECTAPALQQADVAIEFSRPEQAFAHVTACLRAGVPVVCGTTAWQEKLAEAQTLCLELKGAFFYASNFSIGVHIFLKTNALLAKLMNPQAAYKVSIEEIHHTQKLDAPSGTAITTAQTILQELTRLQTWCKAENLTDTDTQLPITAQRIDHVPGTHIVRYQSPIDSIEISHVAHSREGFASGALAAAQWLIGKKGVFGMNDML